MTLMKQTEITVTVNLKNGDPIRFVTESTNEKLRNLGSRLETLMNGTYIGFELGGKLVVVPNHNIQSVVFDPAPQAMIANVVKVGNPASDKR